MKKITILILAICSVLQSQNIAYVDSKYILEKIPDFESAQEELNAITLEWQEEIDIMKKEVDAMMNFFTSWKKFDVMTKH